MSPAMNTGARASTEFSTFKVIIVGGGPVGLTAAHGLERAGIDFLLLEQRPEAIINTGSNLVLRPGGGIQAMIELGLQAEFDAVSTPLTHLDRLDHNAHDLGGIEFFEMMKEHSGIYPRVVSRHNLTKVLYDGLNEASKSKILTSKKLQHIVSVPDGLEVTCSDGTSYFGSMVLGADGAHSQVRTQMRSLALEYGSQEVNAEQPYLTTFQAIWIRIPTDERIMTPGLTCETHGHGASTQFFAGDDTAVLGLYERLEKPTRERQRFTLADEQALVQRWDSLPIIPSGALTLGEAYRGKIECGMISLEEGVVEHWSWAGRIALAGDAAHKFTPSNGDGCNTGLIDVLTLFDEMYLTFEKARRAFGGYDRSAVPSRVEIIETLKKYEAIRKVVAQSGQDSSGRATASSLWSTRVDKFMDCHVISYPAVQRFMASEGIKQAVAPHQFAFLHRNDTAIASTS